MARWLLAVFVSGFALVPARSAEPQPLWEINTAVRVKWMYAAVWVGISPDGKTLVAQTEESSSDFFSERLLGWDVTTRKVKFSRVVDWGVRLGNLNIRSNTFTNRGTILVGGNALGEVRLADGSATTTRLKEIPLAVWADPGAREALWLFDGGLLDGYSVGFGEMPTATAVPRKAVPDKQLLRASWKQTDRECQQAFAASADISRFAIGKKLSPVALTLYTIATDRGLTLTETAAVPRGAVGAISRIQFSPNGKTLATGGEDSAIGLWDVEKAGKDWKPRVSIPLGRGTVGALSFSLSFSPDGRILAAVTWDKDRANLFLIDVPTGKTVASHRLAGQLACLAYSPDGKTLVTGDYSGRIKVWDADALRNPG